MRAGRAAWLLAGRQLSPAIGSKGGGTWFAQARGRRCWRHVFEGAPHERHALVVEVIRTRRMAGLAAPCAEGLVRGGGGAGCARAGGGTAARGGGLAGGDPLRLSGGR